jgi:hypothetical protein
MNERIKELWEQAVHGDGPHTSVIADFAELIVRECMNIARNVGNISEPDDWALDRCYEIEQRIQDRFGVEE